MTHSQWRRMRNYAMVALAALLTATTLYYWYKSR